MSNETIFHRRLFLNDEAGAAMIEATLDNNRYDREGDKRSNYDGTIHITDCSRSVELSLHFGNNADGVNEVRSALRKLDRLIDVAQGMRDSIVRAAKREFPGKKF